MPVGCAGSAGRLSKAAETFRNVANWVFQRPNWDAEAPEGSADGPFVCSELPDRGVSIGLPERPQFRSRPPIKSGSRLRRNTRCRSAIQEAAQQHRSRRVLELAQGLGLDLADTLARYGELVADLLERMIGRDANAEP